MAYVNLLNINDRLTIKIINAAIKEYKLMKFHHEAANKDHVNNIIKQYSSTEDCLVDIMNASIKNIN
jgi:hypothetical protein